MDPKRSWRHGLAYGALARGDVDIVDAYTTDAAIEKQNLVLLEDDRQAFPRYDAVLLMRSDFDAKPLQHLSNRLNEAVMAKLNGQAEAGANFEQVARTFLNCRIRLKRVIQQPPPVFLNSSLGLIFLKRCEIMFS